MRVVLSVVLAMSLCGDALAGPRCLYDEGKPEGTSQPNRQSSFRGLSLESRPHEIPQIVRSLGFDAGVSLYVGTNTVAGINIYKDKNKRPSLGRADFDREGRMMRLSLKDRFFCDAPIFVRRFADSLFEHYGVKPIKVDDDVCFQDVTCFKGISKHGEQFLILRIGSDAELYVRP